MYCSLIIKDTFQYSYQVLIRQLQFHVVNLSEQMANFDDVDEILPSTLCSILTTIQKVAI